MERKPKAITIPAERIVEWQHEAGRLKRKIADFERDLALVEKRLQAVSLLAGEKLLPVEPSPAEPGAEDRGLLGLSPPELILHFVRASPGYVTKTELRERIGSTGYPKEKFGRGFSYFYTILRRMASAKKPKIVMEGDKVKLA